VDGEIPHLHGSSRGGRRREALRVRRVGRGEHWGHAAGGRLAPSRSVRYYCPPPCPSLSVCGVSGHGWMSSYRNTDESPSVLNPRASRSRGLDPTVPRDMLWENVRRLYGIAP